MNKVMKIYILILSIVFTHNTLYSQFLKKIDSKDIEVIKESIPSKETGSRGYSTIEYNYIRVHKVTKKPLRGRYKVIIDKDNIMRIQAFKNGDFDEKNAVNMYVSKNGVTEFLKTIMPAIKEKDIKEFLKDF